MVALWVTDTATEEKGVDWVNVRYLTVSSRQFWRQSNFSNSFLRVRNDFQLCFKRKTTFFLLLPLTSLPSPIS